MPVMRTGPRVVVSVTATGGGDWQVVSTPTGFQGVTSALFADNDYLHGFVRFENGVDWEEYDTDSDSTSGLLQVSNITGTVTIARPATPYASSNSGARVTAGTGTHTLAISLGSGTMKRILREVNGTWKTFTSGDATPSVADYRLFKTAGTTTITSFDSMEDGKLFIVQRGAADITIADGANISLPGNQNLTLTASMPGAIFVEDGGVAILVGTVGPMDWDQVPNTIAATELTISSGAITPVYATHTVDTEADAATDDLVTITATNFKAGDRLMISAANGSRDVVVKASGGNILLPNDVDITLDDTEKTLILRYDGTNWNYVAGAGVGASVTATGSSASRTLADRFAEVTNVKDFGAVGDGSTDDTTALQAAFTYAASNGKRLYFPRGDYLHTATIGTITTSDWYVFGLDASGTILRCSGDTDSFKIDVSAAYLFRINFRGLEFLNTHTTGLNSTGIKVVATTASVTGLRHSTFDKLRFRGVGYGLYFEDTGKVDDGGGNISVGVHGYNNFLDLEFPQYTRYPLGCVKFEATNGVQNRFHGGQYRADSTNGYGIDMGTGGADVSIGDMTVVGVAFNIGKAAFRFLGPSNSGSPDFCYTASILVTGCQFDVMTTYSYHIENLNRVRIFNNNQFISQDANIVNCDLARSLVETRDEIYQYGLKINHSSTAVDLVTITGGDSSSTNATISVEGSSTNSSLSIRGKGTGSVFVAQHKANYHSITGSDSSGAVVTAAALGSDTDIHYRIHGKGAGGVRLASQLANYLQCDGAAASSHPGISAVGSDTNINLTLAGKGTGEVQLATHRTNYLLVQGSATGGGVTIKPEGGDTNVDLYLFAKGTDGVTVAFTGQKVAFYGATPIAKPTVTGSRGGNAALASLCTELANLGLITNSTS